MVLTRAQSLLIIVGEPATLYTDPNWRYLLDVCRLNNSFNQSEEKKFEFPYAVKEKLYVDYNERHQQNLEQNC